MDKRYACAYVRVSTDKQDTLRQINDLKELASIQGYILESNDIYSENISGFTKQSNRPMFSKLLQEIEKPDRKYSRMYVTEVSRLARDPLEGMKTITRLTELGMPLFVKNINMCTIKDGKPDPIFTMVFALLSEFSRAEAEIFKERAMSGQRNKIKDGGAGGGVIKPYGYTKDKNKKLIIETQEAGIVKEIYNYVIEHDFGTKVIAKLLNQRNIPTKTRAAIKKGYIKLKNSNLTRRTNDILWSDTTIYGILTNPIYKGQRLYKNEIVDSPVIIDQKIWDEVQYILKKRANSKIRETRWLYILKGLVKCGVCGRNYYGRYKKGGKDSYYQCSGVRNDQTRCGNTGISIEALESSIWHFFSPSTYIFDYLQENHSDVKRVEQQIKTIEDLISIQEKEKENISEEWRRLNKLYIKGHVSEDYYEQYTKSLTIKSQVNTEKLDVLKNELKSALEFSSNKNRLELYTNFLDNVSDDRYKIRDIVNKLVNKIIVTSVKRNRNNTDYLVSLFLKGVNAPYHFMIYLKPKNVKAEDYAPHYFTNPYKLAVTFTISNICTQLDPEQIFYNEQNILQNKIDQAVQILLFDPEQTENDEVWTEFPKLIAFRETVTS